ncbi:glycosyltransferase [Xanthomarina sp. F1114]|uniref:glycosyltransferase n=1 Tax=Xanthomarina sp. F1114 TaxID=2996019 RepID=UPI00225E045A|nr:glycosyltransferase [Xanthomarina sp. F1114]MCX7548182.1 glycosyltransferase [Xanthomarina sp. F1114]
MQSNNKKICLVVSSLGKGGAQHSAAIQSQMLAKLGYQVHIVTVFPEVFYAYSGTLFNLGLYKSEKNSVWNRMSRLLKFKHYLKEQNFDIIIDHRSRVQAYREFIITKFIYKSPTIYVIHSFETSIMFTKYPALNTYLYKNEIMVGVSKAITDFYKNEYQLTKIQTIYNSFLFEEIQKRAEEPVTDKLLNEGFILFYGRLDNSSKNIELLLEAYKASKLSSNNIKLLLLGNGPDQQHLIQYAEDLQLSNDVVFKPQIKNPFPYVKKALYTVLTSRYEGFPLVIPESLCLETPVISVDCKSGPNEIIKHGFNGLLVANFNVNAFAEAMNSFIFDDALYLTCKENARKSVLPFSMEHIALQWEDLLKNTV